MLVRELIASFGFVVDEASLAKVDSAISNLGGKIKALGAGLLAFGLVRKGFALAEEMQREKEAIEETSSRLGMTAEAYQKLVASGELAGVNTSQISGKIMRMNYLLANAATGGGKLAEKLTKLGISFKDADGEARDSNEVLLELSDKIKNASSHTEKLALVNAVFGRSGASMIRFLSLGSEEIKRLGEEAKATGGLMTDETMEALEKNEIAANKFHLAVKGIRNTLVNFLLPAIGWMYDKGKVLADGFIWLAKKTNIFQAIAMVLGAVTLVTLISRLGAVATAIKTLVFANPMFFAIAAAVLAVILVVDDLIALFRGGKSAIGSFLDEMFGFGTAAQYVKLVKEEMEFLSNFIKDTFKVTIDGLVASWSWLKEAFTTSISIMASVGSAIADFILNPLKFVENTLSGISSLFTSVFNAISEAGGSKVRISTEGVKKGIQEATNAFLEAGGSPTRIDLDRPKDIYGKAPEALESRMPEEHAAVERAAGPGLFAPLADKTTKDFGRGVTTRERLIEKYGVTASGEPARLPKESAKVASHNVNVNAPVHNNITVQATDGKISRESVKLLESSMDKTLLKHAENMRRSLRTTATQ